MVQPTQADIQALTNAIQKLAGNVSSGGGGGPRGTGAARGAARGAAATPGAGGTTSKLQGMGRRAGSEVIKRKSLRFQRAVQVSQTHPRHSRHLGVTAAVFEEAHVCDATEQVEGHDPPPGAD